MPQTPATRFKISQLKDQKATDEEMAKAAKFPVKSGQFKQISNRLSKEGVDPK